MNPADWLNRLEKDRPDIYAALVKFKYWVFRAWANGYNQGEKDGYNKALNEIKNLLPKEK